MKNGFYGHCAFIVPGEIISDNVLAWEVSWCGLYPTIMKMPLIQTLWENLLKDLFLL
jgi:hypothetical protein